MNNSEIIKANNDITTIKHKKHGKFSRFFSHFKHKSHHDHELKMKTVTPSPILPICSMNPESLETISSINPNSHGCSTISNWFTGKNKENVHDKRSSVKRRKYEEIQGNVVFDQTSNSDVYDRILKNSILGTRLVKKAVICNRRSGAINAYGPEDFTPSIEQINKFMILAQAERADRVIIDKHFHVAMDSCLYKDVDDETGVLLADIIQYYTRPNTNEYNIGKYELSGLLTKNSLLIAIYEIGNRTNDAKQLLIEMRDYFDAQGM
ncbi:hypothetical protein MS3_00008431 [Schistosoma haematobium]|uniref:Uncharacterized protein n=2 Tax=Schistosoma haematobium TaxID=6185 RepID=A0A922IKI2_SCHHA|nr:hypothetical protein MS3_00008431 [Schistosoma haematobium]KAH9581234.1 hypothetical protein MS3_00008431 [Schistosoma haematobium]